MCQNFWKEILLTGPPTFQAKIQSRSGVYVEEGGQLYAVLLRAKR